MTQFKPEQIGLPYCPYCENIDYDLKKDVEKEKIKIEHDKLVSHRCPHCAQIFFISWDITAIPHTTKWSVQVQK